MKAILFLVIAICVTLQVQSLRIECLEGFKNETCSVKELKVDDKSESITAVASNGVENIDDLHVFNQRMKFLPANLGEKFTQLTSLRIERSGLKKIDRGSFNKLNDLETLSLWNNDLESLDYDTFDDLPLLKLLDLNDNNIEELDRRIFNKLQALTTLNLDSNYLKALDPAIFRQNTNLERLSIRKNALKTLPITVFQKLEKLTVLNLDNNELEGLPDQLLERNPLLTELTVADNNIESIGIENRDWLTKLKSHNFLFNPCTKTLKQEATIDELLTVIEDKCKAEPPTRIKWLQSEIGELRRTKREDTERIECAEKEFMRNDENINSTREAILLSISGLSGGSSGQSMQSDLDLMKEALTRVETSTGDLKQALTHEESEVNKNFKALNQLVSSEKKQIDEKIDDKIKKVKEKIDTRVGDVILDIDQKTQKQIEQCEGMKTSLMQQINEKLDSETVKVTENVNTKISGVDIKITGQTTQLTTMQTKINEIDTKTAKLTEIETKVNDLVADVKKITKCNFFELSFDFIHSVAIHVDGNEKLKTLLDDLSELRGKENDEFEIDFNILMKTDEPYDPAPENKFKDELKKNCGLTPKTV